MLAREGWDPEQLAENFAGEVRQVFLLQVAPEVADAVDADRERLVAWGEQLGLARSVRILETVGRAIREMKSAPEKIVMLEVAMVRLTKPDLDSSYESLDERLTRVERGAGRVAPTPADTSPALRPIGSTRPPKASAPVVTPDGNDGGPLKDPPIAPASTPSPNATDLALDDVRERFFERVIPRTSRSAQLLLRSAKIESLDGLLLTIAVPSEEMRQNTEIIAQGLKGALEHEFKSPLTIYWTVDASLLDAPLPARRAVSLPALVEEELDRGEESVIVVDSVADHLITEMFPGAQEIS